MLTVAGCLACAAELREVSDSPRLDCELLLGHVIGKDRTFFYSWPEQQINGDQQQRFRSLLTRRKAGEPVAYILGEREFWSLPLLVNNTTLIPRPETELLVELALELLNNDNRPKSVLDLGTGTGAIALAIAKERPNWSVTGVEKFLDALALARANQLRLGIDNVHFQQSDWLDAIDGHFDLIVANPPYIDPGDEHLKLGDVRFEPKTALVAGEKGFADLYSIIRQSPNYLRSQGWLLLEHGYQQGEQVRQVLQTCGFIRCGTRKDLAGLERLGFAQKPEK